MTTHMSKDPATTHARWFARQEAAPITTAAIFSITDTSAQSAKQLRRAITEAMPRNGEILSDAGSTFLVLIHEDGFGEADQFADTVQRLMKVLLPTVDVVATAGRLRLSCH